MSEVWCIAPRPVSISTSSPLLLPDKAVPAKEGRGPRLSGAGPGPYSGGGTADAGPGSPGSTVTAFSFCMSAPAPLPHFSRLRPARCGSTPQGPAWVYTAGLHFRAQWGLHLERVYTAGPTGVYTSGPRAGFRHQQRAGLHRPTPGSLVHYSSVQPPGGPRVVRVLSRSIYTRP